MNEVYELLKQAVIYYLATCGEDGQPRVRPFGTMHLYQGKLYFLTGAHKDVSAQLHQNPRFEICTMIGRDWLRIAGTAVLDPDPGPCASMLEQKEYHHLKRRYAPGDGNAELWYLKDCTATLSSRHADPKVWNF